MKFALNVKSRPWLAQLAREKAVIALLNDHMSHFDERRE